MHQLQGQNNLDEHEHEHESESLHECNGSNSGIWIFACSHCIDSMINNPPKLFPFRLPQPDPAPCKTDCCDSKPPMQILSDPQKEPEKYIIDNKPTVRIYCKAKTNYSLTIRDGKVILAPSNTFDPHQHWIKEEKFSTTVKDEVGHPSFALVNKATGQAIKHSIGETYPVQLIEYNPEKLDKTILWSMGEKRSDGYKAIRAVDNIHLNFDGFEGIKQYGGVRDGTKIVLWGWANGDNQLWTVINY